MGNGDYMELLLLLVLASSLSCADYFIGKNNLAMTPFGFISELLCLLCYGIVCLLDFVFLEYFSLTLLFFSSFRMSLGLIRAWQVLHCWTIPPACSLPLSSLCYVTCLDFQKKYGEIFATEFLELIYLSY